jgi:hypothetical protein
MDEDINDLSDLLILSNLHKYLIRDYAKDWKVTVQANPT